MSERYQMLSRVQLALRWAWLLSIAAAVVLGLTVSMSLAAAALLVGFTCWRKADALGEIMRKC